MNEGFEARRMKRRMFLRRNVVWIAPLGIAAAVGFFFGIGHLVQWLWRVTLVDIFAIKPVSFWQAWGLILLSQILFKAHMQPMARTERWQSRDATCAPEMTPEPQLPTG